MSTPSNIEELRTELLNAFAMVKADPRRVNQCKEMSNAAGKVIGTLKIEIEYAQMRGEKPQIDFIAKRKP